MLTTRILNIVSIKTPWFITACLLLIVVCEENLFKLQARTTNVDCTANRSDVIRQVASLDAVVGYFVPLRPETKNATELLEGCETVKAWNLCFVRGSVFLAVFLSLEIFLRAASFLWSCDN